MKSEQVQRANLVVAPKAFHRRSVDPRPRETSSTATISYPLNRRPLFFLFKTRSRNSSWKTTFARLQSE